MNSEENNHQGSGNAAKEEIKLPTTLAEFLDLEKLSDWPYPMALEGPLDIQSEGLLLGTQEDIAEILRESAPVGVKLLEDLEDRLSVVEEKLNKYAVHILSDEIRPSRLADRLFYSPSQTFLTDVSNSDAVKTYNSSRGHKSTDFADTLMETKKRSLDYCVFPGFRQGELIELPAQLEAPPLLHRISNIQNFNPGYRKFWKKLFLSEASAAIMQDAFWWIFLDHFNRQRGMEEEKDSLFDRIADSYVALFTSINADVKDKFLSAYPDCLAQALFSAYIIAFPESSGRFDTQFKQYLINLVYEWVTGLKPVPGTWKTWNIGELESDGSGRDGDTSAAAKKMMEAAALNRKVEVKLDIDGFTKLVEKLGEEQVAPVQSIEEIKSSKTTVPGGNVRLANPANAIKKVSRESHLIGPGPEYERVRFNTQGRSPLIAHYLHMLQLRDYRQPGKKVRRTEISREPPPGPTYQQFIQSKMTASTTLSREYARICETTNQAIQELEQKKREMNREVENIKKELTFIKNPADCKILLERIADIMVPDRETLLLGQESEGGEKTSELAQDKD